MCAMGDFKVHLTSMVTDVCKSCLHFKAGFRFQGLLGVTLDDQSVLLLDIQNSFYNTSSATFSNHSSGISLKAKATESNSLKSNPWSGATREENSLSTAQPVSNTDDKHAVQSPHVAPEGDLVLPYQDKRTVFAGKDTSGQGTSTYLAFESSATTVGPHPEDTQEQETSTYLAFEPSATTVGPHPEDTQEQETSTYLAFEPGATTVGPHPEDTQLKLEPPEPQRKQKQLEQSAVLSFLSSPSVEIPPRRVTTPYTCDDKKVDARNGSQKSNCENGNANVFNAFPTHSALVAQSDMGGPGGMAASQLCKTDTFESSECSATTDKEAHPDRAAETFLQCEDGQAERTERTSKAESRDTKFSVLTSQGDIDLDMKTEDGVRWFKCNLCSYQSKLKRNLQRHFFTHDSVGFACQTCQKHFRDVTVLAEHVRVAHDKISLLCGECGKTFKTRRALQYHQQRHSGQFKYSCEQCGKKFSTSTHYRDHMNTHTGTLETCNNCGKSFQYRSSYNKHLRAGCKQKGNVNAVMQSADQAEQEQKAIKASGKQLQTVKTKPGTSQKESGASEIRNMYEGTGTKVTGLQMQIQDTGDNGEGQLPSGADYVVAIVPRYTGQDLPDLCKNGATVAEVDQQPHPQPPTEHLNSKAGVSLDDSFIERLAASLDPSTPQDATAVGPQTSLDLCDLLQPTEQLSVQEQGLDASHMTKAKDQQVFNGRAKGCLSSVSEHTDSARVASKWIPNNFVAREKSGHQILMEMQTSSEANSIAQNVQDMQESGNSKGLVMNSESACMNQQSQSPGIEPESSSAMLWPDSDLVLYRFPLLEEEYALQAVNIKQAAQSPVTPASQAQSGDQLQSRSDNRRLAKQFKVPAEGEAPETYCMYPLPQHCYESDLWSTCWPGVSFHNPELLNNHNVEGSRVSSVQSTATTSKLSNEEKISATSKIQHSSGLISDPTARSRPTSLTAGSLPTPETLGIASDDHRRGAQTREQQQTVACDHSTTTSSLVNVPMPSDTIPAPNGPAAGPGLSVREQCIGAIYPQFPEHMPPNIFDDGTA